ncbi:PAAR domain-containing protein [Deinococcus sp. JMULE3]|uniref:PAAR domain-containing protein n=1 Tax=Deinococcus sp. JMULE3 TaxID=2518341 RepID=UPI00157578A2|nr:PAAR domain-containing protein [Deinococcus sp. JMULE3]NTX99045.1 type VI secretion protein [Deinococcus sp. JMULE3]
MPPAARLGDQHTCPQFSGWTPHVGGPITGGQPTVLIGGQPAARLGDPCVCAGPPDTITRGSSTVRIGGTPAARIGDTTAHGGQISAGCPTVNIGG